MSCTPSVDLTNIIDIYLVILVIELKDILLNIFLTKNNRNHILQTK